MILFFSLSNFPDLAITVYSPIFFVLNRLVEKLDEDRSVKDHLIGISSILKNSSEQNIDKFSEVQNNLTIELRAISKQLSKAKKSENKLDHE